MSVIATDGKTLCANTMPLRFLQELYLGSVLMMDPMSLLDYPEVDGSEEILIAIVGEMSEETKK